jgi:choline-glycine betaine transporter
VQVDGRTDRENLFGVLLFSQGLLAQIFGLFEGEVLAQPVNQADQRDRQVDALEYR